MLLPLLTSHGRMPWPLSMIARYTVKAWPPAECLDKTGRRPQQAATTFLPVVSRMRWSGQPTGHTTLLEVLV